MPNRALFEPDRLEVHHQTEIGLGWITAGWPVYALTGDWWKDEWVLVSDGRFVLPLRPIWPGFVIDALFHGAIWFGISFGFGSAKRAIRKKRGRCPKCNYDLRGNRGGDKGCSECGWRRDQ